MTDERIKHLEFIQATIARQASHSFAAKGWSVTVCTAAYFYVITQDSLMLAAFTLIPAVVFAWLDGYYLRNERLFRDLYDEVASPDSTVTPFSMDVKKYRESYEWWKICQSWPWFVLHLGTIVIWPLLVGITISKRI